MMMTWRFLLLAVPSSIYALFFAAAVYGSVLPDVVINEVYYDHPGSDRGFEYVELYCRVERDVPLEGWSLILIDGRTGAFRELWRAGTGLVLERGGLLLIGGDSCVVSPDCYLEGSIENGPDAVALISGGDQIDIVSYGGEGPDCAPGSSLSRHPDRTDPVCSIPTPGARNFHHTDLSISFIETLHVPCEGEDTNLPVLLVNRGLERYSGIVKVSITTIQGGIREDIGSSEPDCDLGSGEEQEVNISCSGISPGKSALEVRIEAEGDSNRANDTGSVVISPSPGEVVISEIMYRPEGGGEWIELYNRSHGAVSLSGWSVSDKSGSSGSISEGEEIAAGGYIILAQDPGAFSIEFPGCRVDVVSLGGVWPRLNDGGDDGIAEEIFIRRSDESLAESVSYSGLVSGEKGRSIERLSPGLCSSCREGIWLRCGASAGATPGERNYCHIEDIPVAGMSTFPDPFCPGLDGTVRFSAPAAAGEELYSACLYDLDGMEVSRLASGPVGAPAVSFTWDGRDKKGRPAVTGLYICVVEFKCGGGGVCRREKCVVRVWAGQR